MSAWSERVQREWLATLLVVLSIIAGGALVWQVRHDGADAGPRPVSSEDGAYTAGSVPDGRAALEVAVAALPASLTYDYRTLDDDLAAATAQMTAAFGAEFAATFDKTVVKLARQKQAVTRAVVRGAGVLEVDGDHARTLVFVDQFLVASKASTSSKTKADDAPVTISQSRVVVELDKADGTWKVSAIQPI